MITLYQYRGGDGLGSVSPPCLKIEMALRKLELDYRLKNLSSPSAVRAVSVTGRLPALEIDGERIADSITILDRLERERPDADLWPSDPAERVRDRLWDHYATDSLYWLGFHQRWVRPDTADAFLSEILGRAPWLVRLAVRATFVPRQRRRAVLHGVGGKTEAQVQTELERGFDTLVGGLEDGPYLQGRDRPARGDLSCTALLVQAGFRGTMPDMMAQIRARPELPALCARTLTACSMDVPAWLTTADQAAGQTVSA